MKQIIDDYKKGKIDYDEFYDKVNTYIDNQNKSLIKQIIAVFLQDEKEKKIWKLSRFMKFEEEQACLSTEDMNYKSVFKKMEAESKRASNYFYCLSSANRVEEYYECCEDELELQDITIYGVSVTDLIDSHKSKECEEVMDKIRKIYIKE